MCSVIIYQRRASAKFHTLSDLQDDTVNTCVMLVALNVMFIRLLHR
jgi:hypothetical protein